VIELRLLSFIHVGISDTNNRSSYEETREDYSARFLLRRTKLY